jgi:hypothetical protein
MQRLKSEIAYLYADTAKGGIVPMSTGNPQALAALHEFLRDAALNEEADEARRKRSGAA